MGDVTIEYAGRNFPALPPRRNRRGVAIQQPFMKTADGSDLKGQLSVVSIRKAFSRRNDFDDARFRCDLEFRLIRSFALSFPCVRLGLFPLLVMR